jgi:hypothetical protein
MSGNTASIHIVVLQEFMVPLPARLPSLAVPLFLLFAPFAVAADPQARGGRGQREAARQDHGRGGLLLLRTEGSGAVRLSRRLAQRNGRVTLVSYSASTFSDFSGLLQGVFAAAESMMILKGTT